MKQHQKDARTKRKARQSRNAAREEAAFLKTSRQHRCSMIVATAADSSLCSNANGTGVIGKLTSRIVGDFSAAPEPRPKFRVIESAAELAEFAKSCGGVTIDLDSIGQRGMEEWQKIQSISGGFHSPKGAGEIRPNFTPAWGPLEKLLADDRVGCFLFIASYPRDGGCHIHAYKHRETRRYLNIDDDGRCYQYTPAGYEEVSVAQAIECAFS